MYSVHRAVELKSGFGTVNYCHGLAGVCTQTCLGHWSHQGKLLIKLACLENGHWFE